VEFDIDEQINKIKYNANKNLAKGGLKNMSEDLVKKINIIKDLIVNSMEDISLIRDFK